MQIILCKTLGYCRGVEKTIENAELCLEKARLRNLNAYCIGNLIHNEFVVESYKAKGLKNIEQTRGNERGVALVRAHGIPDLLREEFISSGFELIDSTCANIQASVKAMKKAYSEGRTVVVVGLHGHAETKTLMGVLDNAKKVASFELNSVEQIPDLEKALNKNSKLSVIVQTTFNQSEYESMVKELSKKFTDIVFCNSFCRECIKRKADALELAKECDAVMVIGSKTSANTVELARYLEQYTQNVYLVQQAGELTENLIRELQKYDKIGICSGTSVPHYLIDSVAQTLRAST